MPDTRHWAFEESSVNLGGIAPDTTDLAKLLLVQFGLVFATDWFMLPIEVPVGSLTSVPAVVVSTVFGERFAVERGDPGSGTTASRAFELEVGGGVQDRRLFLPAATPTSLQSPVVESVAFVRDEIANMAWGIETVVQLPDGASRNAREVALETRKRFEASVPPPVVVPPVNDATVSYRLMTTVPENWIRSFPCEFRTIRERSSCSGPRCPGCSTSRGRPHGCDHAPDCSGRGWMRHHPGATSSPRGGERAGTIVEARWQRTRWSDGRVVVWLGERRSVGRGEASSGLSFDVLSPHAPS